MYNKNSLVDMKKPLAENFFPGPMDVVCARGSAAHNHTGNRLFREMIKQYLERYAQVTSKYMKSMIVTSIVSKVRNDSPSGGFVKEEDGKWYEVGDHLAREKVGQCFRALLRHSKYKKSNTISKTYHQRQEQMKSKTDVSFEFKQLNYFGEISKRIQSVSARSSSNDDEIQNMMNQANSDLLRALRKNKSNYFKSTSHEPLDQNIWIPLN